MFSSFFQKVPLFKTSPTPSTASQFDVPRSRTRCLKILHSWSTHYRFVIWLQVEDSSDDTSYGQNETSFGLDLVIVSLFKQHVVCSKRHVIFDLVCPQLCCTRCAHHSLTATFLVQSKHWPNPTQNFDQPVHLYFGRFWTESNWFLGFLGLLNSNLQLVF